MTPDRVAQYLEAHMCPDCTWPLSVRKLRDNGITLCPKCGERFVEQEKALTYIDEIPMDEYIGG